MGGVKSNKLQFPSGPSALRSLGHAPGDSLGMTPHRKMEVTFPITERAYGVVDDVQLFS